MKKYLSEKLERFLNSRNILKFNFFFHKLFKEKDLGNLELDFSNKPSRIEIVQKIIELKNYKKYLEIGCYKNELFDRVECDQKIGIDPIMGGNYRDTSDNFFKLNESLKFDCIFIDGLHEYSQVKKDIYNSLRCLNENGIILVHDCLPINVFAQAIPRCQYLWNGDVWKSIIELRCDPNYDTYTCYADEGIGVIFKRKNRNLLNLNTKDFKNLKFKEYFENYKEYMNLISYKDLLNQLSKS